MFLALLESLAYALARGVTRAVLDVMKERPTAVEEVPNADDRLRAQHFRDAVDQLLQPASGAAKSGDPAPGGAGDHAPGVGPAP